MNEPKTPRIRVYLALAINAFALSLCCVASILTLAFWKRAWPSLFWQAQFILGLLVLTAFTRSLGLRRVAGFYLLGVGLVPLITLLFSMPLDWLLDVRNQVVSDLFVPIIEESLKAIPLLVLLLWPKSRLRYAAGLSDFLLLGAALGGGFALTEDLLRGWGWREMLRTHAGPHLGLVYLFPNLDLQRGVGPSDLLGLRVVFLGHGAATALVGLALGAAVVFGRRRLWRVLWLLPILAWAWGTWDHIFYNLSSEGELKSLLGWLQMLVGLRGNLSPWALLLGVLAGVGLDAFALWRYHRAHPDTALRWGKLQLWRASPGRHTLLHLVIAIAISRLRRAAAYAARNGQPLDSVHRILLATRQFLEARS